MRITHTVCWCLDLLFKGGGNTFPFSCWRVLVHLFANDSTRKLRNRVFWTSIQSFHDFSSCPIVKKSYHSTQLLSMLPFTVGTQSLSRTKAISRELLPYSNHIFGSSVRASPGAFLTDPRSGGFRANKPLKRSENHGLHTATVGTWSRLDRKTGWHISNFFISVFRNSGESRWWTRKR